jgi:hypothetical protein
MPPLLSGAFLFLVQLNGSRVNAVTQASGLRAVFEDVTEVSAATGAGHFDAAHAVAAIFVLVDDLLIARSVEAGPAAVRVELSIGLEEFLSAGGTKVFALVLGIGVFACERTFGALFAQDAVLLGR